VQSIFRHLEPCIGVITSVTDRQTDRRTDVAVAKALLHYTLRGQKPIWNKCTYMRVILFCIYMRVYTNN